MPDFFLRAITLLPAVLLGACSPVHYRITLRDGREMLTASRPEFVAKTGYYRYRSIGGKDALVRADEVLQMQEQ